MNSTIQNMFFDGIYTTTVNRTLTQNYFLKNIPFLRSFYGLNLISINGRMSVMRPFCAWIALFLSGVRRTGRVVLGRPSS